MPSLVTRSGERVVKILWREYPYWTAARLSGFLYLYIEGRDELRRETGPTRWNNRLRELNRVGINPETVELRYEEGLGGTVARYVARKGALLFSGRLFGA